MNIEGIDIKDFEFGEPIEEKEPNYRDGYIRGIYIARNIIDSKQKEIERLKNDYAILKELQMKTNDENNRLNNIINELEKWLKAHLEDEFYWFKMYDKLQELKGEKE